MVVRRVWGFTFYVTNMEDAVRFYAGLLGTDALKYRYQDYAGFDCGGVEIGLKKVATPQPCLQPLLELLVDDVEKTCDRVCACGGSVSRPPFRTAWGATAAVVADPDGNSMLLLKIDWKDYHTACVKG